MCDEITERDNDAWLTRRGFVVMATAAGLSPGMPALAADLTAREVLVDTPDGKADAFFVHPTGQRVPGVLIWPDILGLRPALKTMAQRLAADGYAVLVVNPYYRSEKAPVIPEGATTRDPGIREKVMPYKQLLTAETTRRDIPPLVAFLDAQPAVDTARGIGVMGYCMGGPMALWSAAALPSRIRGVATFHGGGLVTADADSPHLGVPKMKAQALVAIASNDDDKEPETKTTLRQAFDAAKLPAEIEVYAGAMHGWCPPDSPVYDAEKAERAWGRLVATFSMALRA